MAQHDLNPGAIIALSPALTADQKAVYNSWGKGKYDPRYNQDGQNGPQVIPPAYGLEGVHKITVTGDGDNIEYWNRYVGVTQMGGHGTFTEPRTGVSVTNGTDDLISAKLPCFAGLSAVDRRAGATRGQLRHRRRRARQDRVRGRGEVRDVPQRAAAHRRQQRLHAPSEVVSEPEPNGAPSYASRSATKKYRTAPLHGCGSTPPYFHNGSAATLADVVSTYNTRKTLGLTADQMADLVQYLKSL